MTFEPKSKGQEGVSHVKIKVMRCPSRENRKKKIKAAWCKMEITVGRITESRELVVMRTEG